MTNIPGSSFRYPEVWRPADPAEAWQWKRRFGAEAAFAAGATWLRTQWEAGSQPMPSYLIDLSAVKELAGIKIGHNRLTIGALTSLAQVRTDAAIAANAPMLQAAAVAIAAHSIRQLATIGGNIVTRVGDSLPALIAHEAELVWQDDEGECAMDAESWLDRCRSGTAGPSLLKEIRLPLSAGDSAGRTFSYYRKVGRREAFTPSLATAAMTGTLAEDGAIAQARIAAGGGAMLAQRLELAEKAIIGAKPGREAAEAMFAAVAAEYAPAPDPFATKEYRIRTVANLLAAEAWKLGRNASPSEGG